ncbi:MAG: peptidase M28 [Bacteroidetes bacterium]|nr:MAG: peptidase M28 [Bacteroidota bacterium]
MKSLARSPHFLFAALLLLQQSLHAQDKNYARKIVDTLASPAMHGRGYVMKGDKIAADFIAAEFKKLGLKPLRENGGWFQYFSFPINTFPGNMTLQVQSKGRKKPDPLQPGEEFILRSNSPSIKGTYQVIRADKQAVATESGWQSFREKDLRKKFVYVDTAGISDKKQLRLLEDFVKYPRDVKGFIIPVRPSPIALEEGHNCSRMLPLDLAQVQSTVPVIEISAPADSVTHITINAQAKYIKSYKSQNVLGYIPGSQYPDSFIVFTAHYDHLGHFGKTAYFPGANDNASGVAMMLNLAAHYMKPENKPKCSIAFLAFGAEEVGLLGSRFFTEFPQITLKNIRFLVNMDILGTGDEGITVVNATLFSSEFKEMQRLNAQGSYLPQVKSRGKAWISDHHFFTEKGVPCFYIYTLGGIKAYHDVCDRSQTLPLTKFDEIFLLLRDFTAVIDNR